MSRTPLENSQREGHRNTPRLFNSEHQVHPFQQLRSFLQNVTPSTTEPVEVTHTNVEPDIQLDISNVSRASTSTLRPPPLNQFEVNNASKLNRSDINEESDYFRLVDETSWNSNYRLQFSTFPDDTNDFTKWLIENFNMVLNTNIEILNYIFYKLFNVKNLKDLYKVNKFGPEEYLFILGIVKYNQYLELIYEIAIIMKYVFVQFGENGPYDQFGEYGDYMK